MKRTLIVNCVNINAYEGLFDDRLIFICELMGHIARPHTTALKFAFKLLYLRAKNISIVCDIKDYFSSNSDQIIIIRKPCYFNNKFYLH